jgi:hypothetical protein
MLNLQIESVFQYLYDIGHFIDLNSARLLIQEFPDIIEPIAKLKDTPEQIQVPKPLVYRIENIKLNDTSEIEKMRIRVKIYEDGVVTLSIRLDFKSMRLQSLHNIRLLELNTNLGGLTVNQIAEHEFTRIHNIIAPAVQQQIYHSPFPEKETYAAFCIYGPKEAIGEPNIIIQENRQYIAAFLLGEHPDILLHESQIKDTLDHPFSFLQHDLTIFDLDRCLIIDPTRDYEDILLITELANYLLLELRTLDKILDRALDAAEDEINQAKYKRVGSKLKILTGLRYDAIFTLENVENVAKIIGDYYLADIFSHISNIFKLSEWSKSIRNRLATLSDIYTMAKQDSNERIIIIAEIFMVFLILWEILIPLFFR